MTVVVGCWWLATAWTWTPFRIVNAQQLQRSSRSAFTSGARASARQLRQLRVTAEVAVGLRVESRARSEAGARPSQLVVRKQVSSRAARRFPRDCEEGTKRAVPKRFTMRSALRAPMSLGFKSRR